MVQQVCDNKAVIVKNFLFDKTSWGRVFFHIYVHQVISLTTCIYQTDKLEQQADTLQILIELMYWSHE